MSALTTRILVLGVVDIFGPANGYQLRRELLSWEVERWAHLNPGSIYSMLTTLEKQGAIERHDIALEDGGRPVAVYTITEAGSAEFQNLIFDAIATVPDSGDALPLRVALNFGPAMTRARFLTAVRGRMEVLTMGREIIQQKIVAPREVPHGAAARRQRAHARDRAHRRPAGVAAAPRPGRRSRRLSTSSGEPRTTRAGSRSTTIPAGAWPRSAIATRLASPSSARPDPRAPASAADLTAM